MSKLDDRKQQPQQSRPTDRSPGRPISDDSRQQLLEQLPEYRAASAGLQRVAGELRTQLQRHGGISDIARVRQEQFTSSLPAEEILRGIEQIKPLRGTALPPLERDSLRVVALMHPDPAVGDAALGVLGAHDKAGARKIALQYASLDSLSAHDPDRAAIGLKHLAQLDRQAAVQSAVALSAEPSFSLRAISFLKHYQPQAAAQLISAYSRGSEVQRNIAAIANRALA